MTDLSTRYAQVCQRIRTIESQYGRIPGSVNLIAVSKTQPAASIAALQTLKQTAFGENYLSEAIAKINALGRETAEWHFIGHIQSNKCKEIARNFDWVHSVDRLKIARRLNDLRPVDQPPLNILLQVNLQQETSKSGISANEIADLAAQVVTLPQLKLRGLMAIPVPTSDYAEQIDIFAQVRECFESINRRGLEMDCLSMGMTQDVEAAIAQGATHVRIGTAIFGPRPPKSE